MHATLCTFVSGSPERQQATAAAPGGRQDFLIPMAGNRLLRPRPGSVSIHASVGGAALRGWGTCWDAVAPTSKNEPSEKARKTILRNEPA